MIVASVPDVAYNQAGRTARRCAWQRGRSRDPSEMKIRCTDCRKKISIDDAFAGGVCRCPYCTAIVSVPGQMPEESRQPRPEAPTSRPAFPAPTAVGERPLRPGVPAEAAAPEERRIPVATPVMVQGVFALALLGLLALMLIGVVVVLFIDFDGDAPVDGELPNPFAANPSAPAVAGDIKVAAPVIYVVPASGSMAQIIDYASKMALASIGSLRNGEFSVLLCGQRRDKFMASGYARSNKANVEAAGKFLENVRCRGVSNIGRAMKSALDRKPKTVVLLWRGAADDMAGLAERAKKQGVLIVTIALDASEQDRQSQAAFAKAAGGKSVSYTRGDLAHWYSQVPSAE